MTFEINSKKYGKHTVLIDDEDWEKVKLHKWYVCLNPSKSLHVRTQVNPHMRDIASHVCGFTFVPLGRRGNLKIVLHDSHVLYYRDLTFSTDEYDRIVIKRNEQVLHGGMITENLMQATCARLLYRALVECDKQGLEPFLHVYDSIMIESETKKQKLDAEKLRAIMCKAPAWASDLKLAVDIKIGKRWSK